jgi:hypothetical protein
MNNSYDRPREYLTLTGRTPVDDIPEDKHSPFATVVEEGRNRYRIMHTGDYSSPQTLKVNVRNIVPNPAYDRWLKANRAIPRVKFTKVKDLAA